MYRDGLGVTQDYAEAVRWFEQAGAQGNVVALDVLGRMYHDGTGVKQDYAAAMQWSLKAAAKGYMIADIRVAGMYQNGEGVTKDPAQALHWWLKAAEEVDDAQIAINDRQLNALRSLAQLNVALFYETGLGTKKDLAQAVHWYEAAAALGASQARDKLAQLGASTTSHPDIVLWCGMLTGFGEEQKALVSLGHESKVHQDRRPGPYDGDARRLLWKGCNGGLPRRRSRARSPVRPYQRQHSYIWDQAE